MHENVIMQPMLEKAVKAATLLKTISNPHRLTVLCALADKSCNVTELIELVGTSQTSMSNHLAVLREAGVVDFKREHRELYYHICDDRVFRILKSLYDIYCADDAANK